MTPQSRLLDRPSLTFPACSTISERLSKDKRRCGRQYSSGEKPDLDETSPTDVQTPLSFWTGHLLLLPLFSHIVPLWHIVQQSSLVSTLEDSSPSPHILLY